MITADPLTLFAILVFGHVLGDYALQSDFMARAKDRTDPLPGVPWYQPLAAHSIIHGGLVGLATGSLLLGVLETVIHFIVDMAKVDGRISYNTDQAIHIGCKLLWVALIWLNVF